MTFKDRGIIKWRSAAFLPEHTKMLKDLYVDMSKGRKPQLDEYQKQEFDEKIHYAMEFSHYVSLDVWEDGFVSPLMGRICRLDIINKRIYVESEEGDIEHVSLENVIGVSVLD